MLPARLRATRSGEVSPRAARVRAAQSQRWLA